VRNVAALLGALMVSVAACGGGVALAADDPAPAIRAALEQWRDDFNAGRAAHICDLFAPDLLYDFQGLPEQNFALLCARLHRVLAAKAPPRYHYDLRIKEILVSGDLAVVRLTWTSTVTDAGGRQSTDDEPGLDVFDRQPDGIWRIIRYIAYPANP
jgi:uncharacterized protein (TIGR02246 family)